MNTDRKDDPCLKRTDVDRSASESATEREARKAHESDALDEALKETFPTSDPIAPFIPPPKSISETGEEK